MKNQNTTVNTNVNIIQHSNIFRLHQQTYLFIIYLLKQIGLKVIQRYQSKNSTDYYERTLVCILSNPKRCFMNRKKTND